ncbi:alpha/beta hydrolase [Dictyobacter kobayashii]|uniref:Alpha/beta hydrolase n=1 Tax=Dictyobacter kobayashii TaxID=2014872 RepID=A0A402AF32_9CHLR|nr:alpha/beta fold hydrolase [Dictyobacter kobayashii]GCE17711.1 alpha/beta hydrolase [Dictyobacter kobayashii]
MAYAPVGGGIAMLFTHTSGEVASPVIVFLHGAGLSGRMWKPQMESLSDSYYCLAPDLPEQGQSLQAGPFKLEDAARQVISLIQERVPARRVHLVGLSLGAAVALAVMRLAPDHVDHAIITGTAPLNAYGKFVIALIPLMKLFNIEKQVDASYKQFGIPDEYRADFREDLLLSTTSEFTRHSIEALIDLNQLLPTDVEIPTLVAVGGKENGVARRGPEHLPAASKTPKVYLFPTSATSGICRPRPLHHHRSQLDRRPPPARHPAIPHIM